MSHIEEPWDIPSSSLLVLGAKRKMRRGSNSSLRLVNGDVPG